MNVSGMTLVVVDSAGRLSELLAVPQPTERSDPGSVPARVDWTTLFDAAGVCSREEMLQRLAKIWGIYVPRFYKPEYNADGSIKAVLPIHDWLPKRVTKRFVQELPPALTIVSQLALTILFGPAGLVLATPILAVVMVLVQTLYIEDILGDKAENLPADNDAANADGVLPTGSRA